MRGRSFLRTAGSDLPAVVVLWDDDTGETPVLEPEPVEKSERVELALADVGALLVSLGALGKMEGPAGVVWVALWESPLCPLGMSAPV